MIDTYLRTLKMWYKYEVERKRQILSKLKRQVMRAFNIREEDTQGQTELVFEQLGGRHG